MKELLRFFLGPTSVFDYFSWVRLSFSFATEAISSFLFSIFKGLPPSFSLRIDILLNKLVNDQRNLLFRRLHFFLQKPSDFFSLFIK
jgi:hypothetical protein